MAGHVTALESWSAVFADAVLDKAMEAGEHDSVGRALDAIIEIAKKSPIVDSVI